MYQFLESEGDANSDNHLTSEYINAVNSNNNTDGHEASRVLCDSRATCLCTDLFSSLSYYACYCACKLCAVETIMFSHNPVPVWTRPHGGRVHYTHAEASYARERSVAH